MSGFLLDTNVILGLVKQRPDPKVIDWIEGTEESLFRLSVLNLGEIRKGIDSRPDTSRSPSLESWLNHDLLVRFAQRILPIDEGVADRWGRISAKLAPTKHPLPVADGLIAATAMHHNLTLVTRNSRDVASTGVPVINPWSI